MVHYWLQSSIQPQSLSILNFHVYSNHKFPKPRIHHISTLLPSQVIVLNVRSNVSIQLVVRRHADSIRGIVSTRLSDTRWNLVFFHGEHPGVGSIVLHRPWDVESGTVYAWPTLPLTRHNPPQHNPRGTYFPARQAHLLGNNPPTMNTSTGSRPHRDYRVPVRRPTKWREWRRPWTRALTRITLFLPRSWLD